MTTARVRVRPARSGDETAPSPASADAAPARRAPYPLVLLAVGLGAALLSTA